MACEKYKGLLMGLIDQELTPGESSEIHDHLIKCEKCREEYEQLKESSSNIEGISFEEPQDEVLKNLWKRPYSRWIQFSGLVMVFAGWIFLVIYGLIEILRKSQEPFFSRIAVAAVFIGFLVLLFSVIRERIRTFKTDPYRGVKR